MERGEGRGERKGSSVNWWMNMNRKFYHDKQAQQELPDSRDFDPLQFVVGQTPFCIFTLFSLAQPFSLSSPVTDPHTMHAFRSSIGISIHLHIFHASQTSYPAVIYHLAASIPYPKLHHSDPLTSSLFSLFSPSWYHRSRSCYQLLGQCVKRTGV